MARTLKTAILGLMLCGMTQAASAKVEASAAGSFVTIHKAATQANPDTIWAALTHPEKWWNKEHSWSGDAANFSMTPVPGGCFCETLPRAGFVEHARVINSEPNKVLRLSGALGPLQSEAVTAILTFSIKPAASGAYSIEMEYVVNGFSRMALPDLAPLVDRVLGEQHQRLMKYLESGKPD